MVCPPNSENIQWKLKINRRNNLTTLRNLLELSSLSGCTKYFFFFRKKQINFVIHCLNINTTNQRLRIVYATLNGLISMAMRKSFNPIDSGQCDVTVCSVYIRPVCSSSNIGSRLFVRPGHLEDNPLCTLCGETVGRS